MRLAVFVDYDGTITDVDTFDVLVRVYAGAGAWDALETQLARGEITLRTAMERQAAYVRGSVDDVDGIVQAGVTFDPAFAAFARMCRDRGATLAVVSSGLRQVIERALERNGLADVELHAGSVAVDSDGRWTLQYPGSSPNGIDKAQLVRRAGGEGYKTVYVGDGRSDFDAARVAAIRFAKKGKALERYLADEGLPFTPFTSFREVQRALFSS